VGIIFLKNSTRNGTAKNDMTIKTIGVGVKFKLEILRGRNETKYFNTGTKIGAITGKIIKPNNASINIAL
jgi:hypothetical protein